MSDWDITDTSILYNPGEPLAKTVLGVVIPAPNRTEPEVEEEVVEDTPEPAEAPSDETQQEGETAPTDEDDESGGTETQPDQTESPTADPA